MSAGQVVSAKAHRIQLGGGGLTFDGAGINLGGLVLICGGAVYAVFADSQWWVPLVVLAIIPLVVGISWSQARLHQETVLKTRAALFDRIDSAASPRAALVEVIKGDLERVGFVVKPGSVLNSCIVETPRYKLHLEVLGAALDE